jgi:hypothetical protein
MEQPAEASYPYERGTGPSGIKHSICFSYCKQYNGGLSGVQMILIPIPLNTSVRVVG